MSSSWNKMTNQPTRSLPILVLQPNVTSLLSLKMRHAPEEMISLYSSKMVRSTKPNTQKSIRTIVCGITKHWKIAIMWQLTVPISISKFVFIHLKHHLHQTLNHQLKIRATWRTRIVLIILMQQKLPIQNNMNNQVTNILQRSHPPMTNLPVGVTLEFTSMLIGVFVECLII